MGDLGGMSQAAASVGDTVMNNATQIYEASQNREFNAEQANAQREWSAGQQTKAEDFNASQAALNRTFQADQTKSAEEYNTQMSDTAMQRRVTDLKAAGINPLLAAGSLGGASTPVMSQSPGSTASVSPASGASASSNAMPQTTGAMQALANLRLTNAQTAKVTSDTPTPQYVTVNSNPDGTQSITVNANAGHELGDQALANQKAAVAQINQAISQSASQISLNDAIAIGQRLDNRLLGDTLDGLIKAQNANNALQQTTSQAGANVMGKDIAGINLGTLIEGLRLVIGPVSSAVSTYNKLQYPTLGK